MSRKAQITVFIIVGMVVLFMFFFLIMLASSLQKTKLTNAQEQIVTSLFSKEAVRLYVEDCLSDALEEGLTLLGQQGRIWSDQPGGRVSFDNQRTGIIWSGNRTAYGITFNALSEPNSYPCSKVFPAPEFCRYIHPDPSSDFGNLEFKPQTLENDLKLYLTQATISCVENFTKTNISSSAKLTSTEMKLKLDLREEGINVQVEYPLSFTIGKDDYFYLSQFDFFYDTDFKQLLDAAVVYPLQFDSRYLDFNYTEETLNKEQFNYASKTFAENCQPVSGQNYYTCSKNSFSDVFTILQIQTEKFPLAFGDDIFVFTAKNILHNQEDYEFRIARQNRPPALDYVNRMACPAAGYDYLVIPGDEELGDIDISLFALDPDEDIVSYSFDNLPSQLIDTEPNDNLFFVDKTILKNYPSKLYSLTASSSDGNLKDNQTVRILVDQPLNLGVSLNLPYQIPLLSDTTFPAGTILPYPTLRADGTTIPAGPLYAPTLLPRGTLVSYADFLKVSQLYFVTIEDPVFISVNLPQTSLDTTLPQPEITLNYTNPSSPNDNFEYSISTLIDPTSRSGCFSLPWLKGCNLDAYNSMINKQSIISDWPNLLRNPRLVQSHSLSDDFSHFREPTNNNPPGKLNLTINLNYCNTNEKSDSESVDLEVKQCIPHRNPEHPYAYPNHKSTFGLDATGKIDLTKSKSPKDINPFLATHSCCNDDWIVKQPGEVCFVNPVLGCYENFKFHIGNPDAYLVEQFTACDGERGNVCGGEKLSRLPKEGSEDQLICGNVFGCAYASSACAGKNAWELIKDEGWCNGALGCQGICEKEVAAVNVNVPRYTSFDINQRAIDRINENAIPQPTDNINIGFSCGCTAVGQSCDSNYNGRFNGKCTAENNNLIYCAGDS